MDTTIDQQVAMDEALVPHAKRLRIGRSNFCLLSNIKSMESTLQLVEMLHICPILPHQPFVEPPFEEEILAFLRFLGHSGAIRKLTDVNINKLHQPWRSFAAIIKNVEHKDIKKSNKMYYPRFTKFIIHHFMSKDLSIPRRNKFGVLLPIELTNEDIRNSNAYKEYYAVATGATPPKPKASVRKTRSIAMVEGVIVGADIGRWATEVGVCTSICEVVLKIDSIPTSEETRDEESFDPIPKTLENNNDEGNGEENLGTNVGREEGHDEEEEEEEDELYRDVNINLRRGIQLGDVHTTQEVEDSHVTLTLV
nr:hypothetical protein [Tanacetum cinerariifolium]